MAIHEYCLFKKPALCIVFYKHYLYKMAFFLFPVWNVVFEKFPVFVNRRILTLCFGFRLTFGKNMKKKLSQGHITILNKKIVINCCR